MSSISFFNLTISFSTNCFSLIKLIILISKLPIPPPKLLLGIDIVVPIENPSPPPITFVIVAVNPVPTTISNFASLDISTS